MRSNDRAGFITMEVVRGMSIGREREPESLPNG
jgi:hypothetical protein